MCLYELYFYFLWRLIFSWHSSSGLLFISSISVWTRSFKKKEKNHCHLVFVLYLWLFCSNMQTLVFPGFFWHCTFNLKCFLYLLDINVLPFFNRVVQVCIFFFFIFFIVTDCSVRTEMWGLCVHRSGGCCFSGACLSTPAFSLLIYIKWYLYLEYNATFPVDNRHTAHVEKMTNGMLCLYAH